MTWKITSEEVAPPVPDGEYSAMPVEINQLKGPHGPMVKIDFQITSEDEWDGRRVSGIASKKLSANTKLGAWIAAILGGMPRVGREVTEDDILHTDCIVLVRQETNAKNRVFANVIEVYTAE